MNRSNTSENKRPDDLAPTADMTQQPAAGKPRIGLALAGLDFTFFDRVDNLALLR